MKKLFLLLVAGVVALSSCKQEPSLTLSQSSASPAAAGEVLKVDVSSNCGWKATCSDQSVVITPAEGLEGTTSVSITVPENPVSTPRNFTVAFTASNEVGMISANYEIAQQSAAANVSVQMADGVDVALNGYAATLNVLLNASNDWSVTAPEGITVEPASGTFGQYELTISVPENSTNEEIKYALTFSLNGNEASQELNLTQPVISSVTYAGVSYKVKWLEDGNLWMVENLRYIPEGKTPSDDVTAIDNGVWFPVDSLTKKLSNDENLIKEKGYIYNIEAAFGIAPGSITPENYASFEGTRGICPEGWHIPTATEFVNLVGKSTVKSLNNTNAPYYDSTKDVGSFDKANESGWNVRHFGAINVTNKAATKGNIMNIIGYFIGSSAYTTDLGYKESNLKNDDGTLKNAQYLNVMISTNKAAGNNLQVAFFGYRSGASVRCVKNK